MITFKCECGKVLKVKDEAAGKRVRCPACSTVVQVPAPAKPAGVPADAKGAVIDTPKDGADFGLQDHEPEHGEHHVEGEGKHCPACHMLLPVSAIICTTCGHDFRTGKTYEQPKNVVEKVPWKLIGKWVLQIAALAVVAGLGWWAYKTVMATKEGGETPKEDQGTGGTSRQLRKRAGYLKHKPALRVVAKGTYVKPLPPKSFTLTAADGKHTRAEAFALLRARLEQEAGDRMRVQDHTVLKKGQSKPFGASELLELRLDFTVGWAFDKQDGKPAPTHLYVATCKASIVRKSGAEVWPGDTTDASYKAERPGAKPTDEDAAAIAKLAAATTDLDLAETTGKTAGAVVARVLNIIPPPSYLAKRLAEADGGGGK